MTKLLLFLFFWFKYYVLRESRGRCRNSNPIWLPFFLYFVRNYIENAFSSALVTKILFSQFLLYSCCWWFFKCLTKRVLVILRFDLCIEMPLPLWLLQKNTKLYKSVTGAFFLGRVKANQRLFCFLRLHFW